MKIAQFIYFVMLICGANAVAHPTANELWNNVRLVHLTHHLAGSTVVPGAIKLRSPDHPIIRDVLSHAEVRKRFGFKLTPRGSLIAVTDVNNINPRYRFSSHWTVFEPVRNLRDEARNNWDACPIAIIEPARHFKGQLFGGYHHDMMVVGPYELSEESFVFAPVSMKDEIIKANPNFRGTYWFYPPIVSNARDAVNLFNRFNNYAFQRSALGNRKDHENYFNRYFGKWRMDWTKPTKDQTQEELIAYYHSSRRLRLTGDMRIKHATVVVALAHGILSGKPELDLLRDFVTTYEEYAHTGHIFLDGNLFPARDVFSAWIEKENLFWGHHSESPFDKMEDILEPLFKDRAEARFSEEWLMARQESKEPPKQARGSCSLTKQAYEDGVKEAEKAAESLRKAVRHLPQAAKHLEIYLKEASQRLVETKTFCGFDN